METKRREIYTIPLYSFESPGAFDETSTHPTDADEPRLDVRLDAPQTGTPHIVVIQKRDETEREAHYNFRVTDESRQQCAYEGDVPHDVPIHVLHAIHTFGYSVENISTLGTWFTDWWEGQAAIRFFSTLSLDHSVPEIEALAHQTALRIDLLNNAVLLRAITTESEYDSIWQEFCDDHGWSSTGGASVPALKEFMSETINESEYNDLLGDEDGETTLFCGVTPIEFDTDSGHHIAIDLVTDFGIERFLFNQVGENQYVYVHGGHSTRPNPEAVLTLKEDGYQVTNAATIAAADGPVEKCELAALLCEELQERGFREETSENHPTKYVIKGAYEYVLMLFQVLASYAADPEQFAARAADVRDHVDISSEAVSNCDIGTLSELLSATIKLLDSETGSRALERVQGSPVSIEDIDEELKEVKNRPNLSDFSG